MLVLGLVGERFFITAAHCFNNLKDNSVNWPQLNGADWNHVSILYYSEPNTVTSPKYEHFGIAYFVNEDMYIGTRRSGDEAVLDIARNDYECGKGGNDIAIVVLRHADHNMQFHTSNSCSPINPCPANERCTPYGFCSRFHKDINAPFVPPIDPESDSETIWESQSFWPDDPGVLCPYGDCGELTPLTYGHGNSVWGGTLGFTPKQPNILRAIYQNIEGVAGEMIAFEGIGFSDWRTNYLTGDSGGPLILMEKLNDNQLCQGPDSDDYNSSSDFKYLGVVSGAGLREEECIERAAALTALECLICAPLLGQGNLPGYIACVLGACSGIFLANLLQCDVESCFTSIYHEMDWIMPIIKNIDGDGDGFIPQNSLAQNQALNFPYMYDPENETMEAVGLPNKTVFSGNWDEPQWPTEPLPGGTVHSPINCTLLPPANWKEVTNNSITMWDNCPDIYNPAQKDYDCDGVGDICDNCIEHFNPAQENEDGDACDACPTKRNKAEKDLNEDGVLDYKDQWDLDGDAQNRYCVASRISGDIPETDDCYDDEGPLANYGGDICDNDPDGDNATLTYPETDDYPEPLESKQASPVDYSSGYLKPKGDCAPFLWTLTSDRDDDRVCDTYNYTSATEIPDWLIFNRGVLDGSTMPGDSYLKREHIVTKEDVWTGHYTSQAYKFYRDLPEEQKLIKVIFKGKKTAPSEIGYSWVGKNKVSFWGYTGCLYNLIDLWRYYGGTDEHGRYMVSYDPQSREVTFDEDPQKLIPDEFQTESYELLEKELLRSLDPEICKVDNCIRFTSKKYMPSQFSQIDELSSHIMRNDINLANLRYGTEKTKWCWSRNGVGEFGSTIIKCTKRGDGFFPGYESWYKNGYDTDEDYYNETRTELFQADYNDDGIGDKCFMTADVSNLIQEHAEEMRLGSDWMWETKWENYIDRDQPYEYYDSMAYDKRTGFPVKLGNPLSEYHLTENDINSLCNGCDDCKIREKTVYAAQRLSFNMKGFTSEPTKTTIGACSCLQEGENDCYGINRHCWKPDKRGWETDGEIEYEAQVKERDYFMLSGRPRYPGLRNMANRETESSSGSGGIHQLVDYWKGKEIAPVCKNDISDGTSGGSQSVGAWTGSGVVDVPVTTTNKSWDEKPGTHTDEYRERVGCQEISMTYKYGKSKTMTWRHLGQQEPDPGDFAGGAYPGIEQQWLEGHKTKMRIGTKLPDKETDPATGRDNWFRQWHSGVPTSGGGFLLPWTISRSKKKPHDRPYTEEDIGSYEGVIVLEKKCRKDMLPPGGLLPNNPPIIKVSTGDLHTEPGLARDPSHIMNKYLIMNGGLDRAGSLVNGILTRVDRNSGNATTVSWEAPIVNEQGNSFPMAGFGYLRIYLTETEAETYAYSGSTNKEEGIWIDVIVGGIYDDGLGATISSSLWIATSWSEVPMFSKIEPMGAIGVTSPHMILDRETGQIYLVGGMMGREYLDRVYALRSNESGMEWVSTWTSAPDGLFLPAGGAAAVDQPRKRAFIVAEDMSVKEITIASGGPAISDVTAQNDAPPEIEGASVEYHNGIGSIVLYGGTYTHSGKANRDLWLFNVKNQKWTVIEAGNKGPSGRTGVHIVPGTGSQIYLVGGYDEFGTEVDDTVWEIDAHAKPPQWSLIGAAITTEVEPGTVSIEGVYVANETKNYDIKDFVEDPYLGDGIQILFENPNNDLTLVAYSSDSSTSARVSSPEVQGKLSLYVYRGEHWKLAVVPRDGNGISASGSSYSISVKFADKGAKIKDVFSFFNTRFDASGDIACIADWAGLRILQRQGDQMVKTGSVPMFSAADVVVDAPYAYLVDFFNGLQVVDISDPQNPTIVGSEWILGFGDSITKIGNRVYIGAGIFGVQVVDVSDPAHPTWVDSIGQCDIVVDVSSAGGLLMVSKLCGGIDLYSIQSDSEAALAGSYSSSGWIDDTSYHGGRMYVKRHCGSMEVVDLSKVSQPKLMTTLTSSGKKEVSMRLGYDMAVVPGTIGGIRVFDIEPEN